MTDPFSCNELFVYGTLAEGALRARQLGRRVRALPAPLPGYQRLLVIGEDYPAPVRCPGAVMERWLLLGLRSLDLIRLDRYEGEEYRRPACRRLGAGRCLRRVLVAGRPGRAWVYLWCDRRRRLRDMV